MSIEIYDERNVSTVHDKISIKRLRSALGLPERKAGFISCLRCDQRFNSEDKKVNRICDLCKGSKEIDYSDYFVGISY